MAFESPTPDTSVPSLDLRLRWTDAAALTIILLLAAILRGPHLFESLWLDELHTSWVVADDWRALPERARIGNQSPLFFAPLKLLSLLLGESEWALRTPSLLMGIGLVAAAFLAVRRWTGSTAAAGLTALIAAVDARFVFFATEARPYAAVQLVAFLHAWLLWTLTQRPSLTGRAAVVLLGALLFHLHYTSLVFLSAEVMCAVVLIAARQSKYTLKMMAIDAALSLALASPALPHFREIIARRSLWEEMVRGGSWWSAIGAFDAPAYALLCVALGLLLRLGRATSKRPPIPAATWVLWIGLMLGPPLAAWGATVSGLAPILHSRYLIAAGIAPMILAGIACGTIHGTRRRAILAIVTGAIVIALSPTVARFIREGRSIDDRVENWRAAATWIDEQRTARPSLPIALRPGLLEGDQLAGSSDPRDHRYGLFPLFAIYRLPGLTESDCLLLPSRERKLLSAAARQRIVSSGGALIVARGSHETAQRMTSALVDELGGRARTVESRRFGHVHGMRLSVE